MAKKAIGEKGNEAIRAIAGAMEICRLPIHVRFVLCNLNEASVRALTNSLLSNSSLIGITCLFHPCMVEKYSNGYWDHDATSSAARSLENAVIRTLAPLQIWDNENLLDHIILLREKLKLRTLLCSLPYTDGPAKYLPVEIIRKILLCIEDKSDSESEK